MSRSEYRRTQIGWPVFSLDEVRSAMGLFETDTNATAWLYYLFVAVPVLATGIAVRQAVRDDQRTGRAAAIVALSLMTMALWYSFLRGNLAGRLGEMGPPVVVLAAWLLAQATTRQRPWPHVLLTGPLAIVTLLITIVCTWHLGSVAGDAQR